MASFENVTSVYFDGKKTATRVMIKNVTTNEWSLRMIVKDHYVVIVEPVSEYLTHATPVTGYWKQSGVSGEKKNLTQHPKVCFVCDGNNVSLRSENGAIQHLEILLSHQLHYFIGHLNGNELRLCCFLAVWC